VIQTAINPVEIIAALNGSNMGSPPSLFFHLRTVHWVRQ
jgi:hypothetical protein